MRLLALLIGFAAFISISCKKKTSGGGGGTPTPTPTPTPAWDVNAIRGAWITTTASTALVKEVDTAKTDLVVQRLDTLIQYMERIDWKLWMVMGMIRMIGEENGYKFSFYHDPETLHDSVSINYPPRPYAMERGCAFPVGKCVGNCNR